MIGLKVFDLDKDLDVQELDVKRLNSCRPFPIYFPHEQIVRAIYKFEDERLLVMRLRIALLEKKRTVIAQSLWKLFI